MIAIQGGCLYGECRYETDAEPINVRACHCHRCQKATGAPFYARVAVPLDRVTYSGPVGWYHSSPALRRGFCMRCGTTLFSERAAANVMGLTMGSLDDLGLFKPESHIWLSSKQPWVALADDDVPHYRENPPA
ncbi:GFA family protein [Sphingomonas sp. MMS24-J13]|uniref:GFA family protein n=1 Tax=Sphingomonas sp. MMS24-J13 TaxID=3238686 RepID=UPI00384E79F4